MANEQEAPKTVKMTATNTGTGARGVNFVNPETSAFEGTKMLAPGQSAVIVTTEAEMAGVVGINFVPVKPNTEEADAIEDLDNEDDRVVRQQEALDNMSDDELHAALEQADGRRRPANASRQTLTDQALELGIGLPAE